jgi:molybdopterin synthase catalytic subunit
MIRALVTQTDIDVTAEIERLEALAGGAVGSFIGIVRGDPAELKALELQTYHSMALRALQTVCEEAVRRWSLTGVTIVHRYGVLPLKARIVFVGTASAHRAEALDACAFLIDWTKTRAPFWKRELAADGSSSWVEPREQDAIAADRWVSP